MIGRDEISNPSTVDITYWSLPISREAAIVSPHPELIAGQTDGVLGCAAVQSLRSGTRNLHDRIGYRTAFANRSAAGLSWFWIGNHAIESVAGSISTAPPCRASIVNTLPFKNDMPINGIVPVLCTLTR